MVGGAQWAAAETLDAAAEAERMAVCMVAEDAAEVLVVAVVMDPPVC